MLNLPRLRAYLERCERKHRRLYAAACHAAGDAADRPDCSAAFAAQFEQRAREHRETASQFETALALLEAAGK